jgi:hypothetical protein
MWTKAFIAAGAICQLLAIAELGASHPEDGEIHPADVYARLEMLTQEIELVRAEMGAPKDDRPLVVVRNAEPRHNYFQALTLCRNAQRLCLDLTGEEGEYPPPAPRVAQPADVAGVVSASLVSVRRVKTHLGITQQVQLPPRHAEKTPSDVFPLLTQANRQLRLMLDSQPTPTAVYEQLTEAVGAANRLLARFPGAARPQSPAFEHGKTPADVHGRLMHCAEHIGAIIQRSGSSTIRVDYKLTPAQIRPGDVYELASLIVSDLRYLESNLPRAPGSAAFTDSEAGRKLPSHNFQRAGLLEAQLNELQKQVEAAPGWLNAAASK